MLTSSFRRHRSPKYSQPQIFKTILPAPDLRTPRQLRRARKKKCSVILSNDVKPKIFPAPDFEKKIPAPDLRAPRQRRRDPHAASASRRTPRSPRSARKKNAPPAVPRPPRSARCVAPAAQRLQKKDCRPQTDFTRLVSSKLVLWGTSRRPGRPF